MSIIDTERYMIGPPAGDLTNQQTAQHHGSTATSNINGSPLNSASQNKPHQRGHRKHYTNSSQSNSSGGSIRSNASIDSGSNKTGKTKKKPKPLHPSCDTARPMTVRQASNASVTSSGTSINGRRSSHDSQIRTHSQESQTRNCMNSKSESRDRSLSQDRNSNQNGTNDRPSSVNMIGIVESLSWFHPNLTRHIAESILMQNGQDGAYLLRPCSKPGELALSVRCRDSVKHIAITHDGKVVHFGMATFTSIPNFVQHFDNHPMIAGETGVLTQLKYPYPRDVEEPALYETVRIHAELGQASSPQKHQMFAVGSKEGYLTKRGAIMKNWQTRWFVLVKDELKYYGEKGDRSPKRTLQLSECKGCLRDYTQGKDNCLRLLFNKRTFYMYAATEEEAKEWMNLLLWKLENLHKSES